MGKNVDKWDGKYVSEQETRSPFVSFSFWSTKIDDNIIEAKRRLHDLFEGICHYDMCHIINHCISSNYFSLRTLNIRKQMFDYGGLEIDNIPPSHDSLSQNFFAVWSPKILLDVPLRSKTQRIQDLCTQHNE